MTKHYSHPMLTHRNGDKCIWLEGTGWFVPRDTGGEGYRCYNPEHEEILGKDEDEEEPEPEFQPGGMMIDGLYIPQVGMFGYKNIGDIWKLCANCGHSKKKHLYETEDGAFACPYGEFEEVVRGG